MKRRNERYFSSKKDLWLGLVIWFGLLFALVVEFLEHRWHELAGLVPGILIIAWICRILYLHKGSPSTSSDIHTSRFPLSS